VHRSNTTNSFRWLCQLLVLLSTCSTPYLWAEDIDGFTEPYRDIDVAASELGSIASISVTEGQRVRAGQILAQLDDNVLRASLAIAEAGRQFEGRLDSALAELELQSDMLRKLELLREQKHASQQEVDRTLSQRNIADARVKSVREELIVKALECKRIEAQLERRRIYSPIDGIITLIYRDQGEFVSAGDPNVLKVVQLDPLLVVFSVPSEKAQRISPDQVVKVRLEDSKTEVDGFVEFISPTADAQSGTSRVRVRIPNTGERLPSGATCLLLLPKS